MDVFAAATGCLDPQIARLFLERADNDVTRAVNHFLDTPGHSDPSCHHSSRDAEAAPSGRQSPAALSRRGTLKRSRSPGQPGNRQEILNFEHASTARRTLRRGIEGISSPDKRRAATRQIVKGGASDPALDDTAEAAPHGGLPVPTTSVAHRRITHRCRREGILFRDDTFPPEPSSLDGRAGLRASPTTGGAGGKEAHAEASVRCKCGTPARVVTVSKAGPNQGRLFYGCAGRKCSFFRWADDAPHTRQALALLWERFSPPRFKLAATATSGGGKRSTFRPQDIRQGAVGDCWFLAGLAVVSERSDLIERVLGSNVAVCDAVGCYEVQLFKDGRWGRVLVDNWLPCKDPASSKGKDKGLDHLPAFAKASNNQTWPCIVEKAFAKQHGSYNAISGGHVCEAFEALTGAPTETIVLDDDDSETNWAKLLSFSQAGFPMGCATAWDPSRSLRDVGLVSTHAYSVLEVRELPLGVRGARQPSIKDWAGLGSAAAAAAKARLRDGDALPGQPLRLVRVRNPWGKREWTGEWSDNSDRWTESIRQELGWSQKNDGTFWMTWQDFMTRFELVDVCKARRGWEHASVAAQVPPPPGGSRSFRIRPTAAVGEQQSPKTWAYITVVQPTKRGRKDRYWYRALGLLVTETAGDGSARSGGESKSRREEGPVVAYCLGGAKRRISCEVFLEVGKAYTATVVCLGGQHHGSFRHPKVAEATPDAPAALERSDPFAGFVVTVYSARPVQVVAAEQRTASAGYFHIGPSMHQVLSHLWLKTLDFSPDAAVQEPSGGHARVLQSFGLGERATLVVITAGDSAVFFVLINAGSQDVVLSITLTALVGATTCSSSTAHDGVHKVRCAPSFQKVCLILARKADYGTFEYEFFYRLLGPPPPQLPGAAVEPANIAVDAHPSASEVGQSAAGVAGAVPLSNVAEEALDLCSSEDDEAQDQADMEARGTAAEREKSARVDLTSRLEGPTYAVKDVPRTGGVFSEQPLSPGASSLVTPTAGSAPLAGLTEGVGRGIVGGGDRGIGSAL